MAIAAPLLTPWDPNRIDFKTGARQPPSALHPLGTDVAGRDVWAGVLYGGRTSGQVGFRAVAPYPAVGVRVPGAGTGPRGAWSFVAARPAGATCRCA